MDCTEQEDWAIIRQYLAGMPNLRPLRLAKGVRFTHPEIERSFPDPNYLERLLRPWGVSWPHVFHYRGSDFSEQPGRV
jgi:hypothetical protein